MEQDYDIYKTIAEPTEVSMRERSSRFLAFAYPVSSADEVKECVDKLKKKYYDATHHCYAYRIGASGEDYRANDDGEPSGTAGRPILGQMFSAGITNCLIVVVRYFGGTKLGVPGLISAYREAAQNVINEAVIIEKTVNAVFRVEFPYVSMNGVMHVLKDEEPRIISQEFDNTCTMILSIRHGKSKALHGKLAKVDGANVAIIEERQT